MSTTDHPIRVLLADEHRLVRGALSQLIDSFPGITVVAGVGCSHDLLKALSWGNIDVALIDNAMLPLPEAATLGQVMAAAHPDARVAILSMYASNTYIDRMLGLGAHGFVHKDAAVEDLQSSIRRLADGETIVCPGFSPPVSDTPPSLPEPAPVTQGFALTRRQKEVLTLIARGYRTRGIAEVLGVSVKTVETHRAGLMRRLGVHSMAELVHEAIRRGLISTP